MKSDLKGLLPLSNKLTPIAQQGFCLHGLRTGTLVALAQLCDDDCIALFTKHDVKIIKHDEVIIQGTRAPNGLWTIPINTQSTHQINGILRLDQTKNNLASYHHGVLGSPVPSTLLHAIRKGNLITFPGLTTTLISKHLPKSINTSLGHQDQQARNLRSTKLPDADTDISPRLSPRSHQISVLLLDKQDIIKSYSDQTGRFPVPSSRGNNYLFIFYHQDTNSIHAVAIPNRQAASICNAWVKIHKLLMYKGHAPNLHILDNE